MSETITIKFKAKDENLVKTITELANAQAKFNNSVKSGNTSADNAAKSNNSLKNSVANFCTKNTTQINVFKVKLWLRSPGAALV